MKKVLIGNGIGLPILGLKKCNKTYKKCRIIAITSLVAVLPMILACTAVNSGEEESSSSPSYSSSSYSDEDSQNSSRAISESEKESIAEDEVLKRVYKELQKYDNYDISATKYKIGSVTNDWGNEYTVNGTLYLYDKYGSLKRTATFSGSGYVKDDGSVSHFSQGIIINFK